MNIAIKYGTEKHSNLMRDLDARYDAAERRMADRLEKWKEQEKAAQAYVHLSDLEKKATADSRQSMSYKTIHVPYSYGMMMSAHTYFCSVFLSRTPVFQYEGWKGEDQIQETAIEALMDYQLHIGKNMHPLFIWLYDACKYGQGIIGAYWDEEWAYSSSIQTVTKEFLGVPIPGTETKKRITQRAKQYEGARLFNVQPNRFFWDPSVTLANLQKGEFCGREYLLGWNEFSSGLAEDVYTDGGLGKEKLEMLFQSTKGRSSDRDSWLETPENEVTSSNSIRQPKGSAAAKDFYIRLIPKEWELGSSEHPEIWWFTVLDKKLIVRARPLGTYVDVFPFFTLEQEIEGYALYKPGVMEQLQPFNDVLSWLINSHFYNVESSLNNQFIYDPSMVRMKDVLQPGPGKRIQALPAAYGKDLKNAVVQLQSYDVTQSHLSDFDKMGALMQRATGIADGVMGMLSPGGRKTATEVRTSTQGAVNRLKTISEYMSAQGFAPLSGYLLSLTQQYFDDEGTFRVTGDQGLLQRGINVTPDLLQGVFAFKGVDGTMPIDRFAQAQLYQELMTGLASNPQIAGNFDFVKMAGWIAQLFGMKSMDSFKIEQAPQAGLEGSVQAGNMVPLEEAANAMGGDPNANGMV